MHFLASTGLLCIGHFREWKQGPTLGNPLTTQPASLIRGWGRLASQHCRGGRAGGPNPVLSLQRQGHGSAPGDFCKHPSTQQHSLEGPGGGSSIWIPLLVWVSQLHLSMSKLP